MKPSPEFPEPLDATQSEVLFRSWWEWLLPVPPQAEQPDGPRQDPREVCWQSPVLSEAEQ